MKIVQSNSQELSLIKQLELSNANLPIQIIQKIMIPHKLPPCLILKNPL